MMSPVSLNAPHLAGRIHNTTITTFTWRDRLRVLFGGSLRIDLRIDWELNGEKLRINKESADSHVSLPRHGSREPAVFSRAQSRDCSQDAENSRPRPSDPNLYTDEKDEPAGANCSCGYSPMACAGRENCSAKALLQSSAYGINGSAK